MIHELIGGLIVIGAIVAGVCALSNIGDMIDEGKYSATITVAGTLIAAAICVSIGYLGLVIMQGAFLVSSCAR